MIDILLAILTVAGALLIVGSVATLWYLVMNLNRRYEELQRRYRTLKRLMDMEDFGVYYDEAGSKSAV